MESLTIGKVAQLAGVGVETIRYYQRRGLVEEPHREESGYRQYTNDTVTRIRFIKRTKELGFSLKEIKGLLSLRVDPHMTCEDIKTRAVGKIHEIEVKILELQKIKNALTKLIISCERTGRTTECPILDFLDREESL